MKFYFKGLLQNSGWLENTIVETDSDGRLVSIEERDEWMAEFKDYAIPGFQNAHSHAFQYAMAGLAENHTRGAAGGDDFLGAGATRCISSRFR